MHTRHARRTPARPGPRGYPPRRPEETLLHRTLSAHWPAFKGRAGEHGGLPEFVLREVYDYLACGLYEDGWVVARSHPLRARATRRAQL